MRGVDAVRGIIAKLAALIARARRRSDFVCADCERWERCGQPPSNKCIVMAAQIARDGGRPFRRTALPLY